MKLDSPNVKPFPKWHTDNLSVYAAGQTAIEKGETEFNCPCCGAEAKLQIITLLDAPCHYSVAYIKCTKCRIRTENRRVDRHYGDTNTVNDVIDDWNNRPLRKE